MSALTMFLSEVLTIVRKLAVRRQLERSLGQVLARSDDSLLDDIGMTRHAVLRLIANPPVADPLPAVLRFRSFSLASATGAGSFR